MITETQCRDPCYTDITTDLLKNCESSLGGFLESNALMILLLQRLLGSLTAAADGLGIELEIGAARVHVEQLGTILINPIRIVTLNDRDHE